MQMLKSVFASGRARNLLGSLLLAALTPALAVAAPVRGRIAGFMDLLNPVWAESRSADAHSYTFREPSPTVKAEFRRLFPYIPKELCVALMAATPQPKMKNVQLRLGGGRTTPVTVVVTPGTEIHFKNTDPFTHRLYGVGIKEFSAGDTKPDGERVWTVPAAGVYEIRDELVPSLRTWIVAEPNVVAFGYPDVSGAFNVELPLAGDITVQVFFAGKAVGSSATMTITNITAPIDLTKAPIKVVDKSKAASDSATEEK
jgi:plastocyanin